jgi:hypothetical protein
VVFIVFLEAPHNVLTSLQLSAECGQNRSLKHLANVCVLSGVCVDGSFTFLFVLFLFCLCSVYVLFLFVFVSLVWTRPRGPRRTYFNGNCIGWYPLQTRKGVKYQQRFAICGCMNTLHTCQNFV